MAALKNKFACPCCGYQTLEARSNYDICRVCWWEGEGQDNENANEIQGGPNYGLSLLKARFNFLKFGIYDPERKDLLENRDNPKDFNQLRKFIVEEDGKTITEVGANWRASLDEEEDLS